ncbi:carbohydrate kinase family protein [Collinsella sp. zg1085]|uniref:carbohydrate kinase family protein n=1 Tax=Collinsella sp. zg1085 TaxID=2844380 RepID=UPI001C0ADA9A|nr:carbohydrate kinase family protein [Collinsella sp. zg1085]QWT18085.1 carbohydrate kinase family protein [Collinsella sp. zg1085]
MSRPFDVVCVGAALVDVPLQPVSRDIFDYDSYPLNQIAMTIGGDAINESTILSRLGARVELLSMVGDDAAGAYILKHCEREGIDYTGVQQRAGIDTSINVGLISADGERSFVTNRNGSLWKLSIDDINQRLIARGSILSMASIFNSPLLDNDAMVAIFKVAKAAGMTIVADLIKPRLGETLDDIAEALSYVDYFFPNNAEAAYMTGKERDEDIADVIMSYGVRHLAMKVGRRGAYVCGLDMPGVIVPAMPGIVPIDTTGAGDNFASGFITGLLEGLDPKECAVYGNVAASVAIESIGATTGITSREVFDERLYAYRAQHGAH